MSETRTQDEGSVLEIEEFTPDYDTPCEVCDQTPTVDMTRAGRIIIKSNLCGPCMFGEAAMLDPEKWNE